MKIKQNEKKKGKNTDEKNYEQTTKETTIEPTASSNKAVISPIGGKNDLTPEPAMKPVSYVSYFLYVCKHIIFISIPNPISLAGYKG